MNLPPGIYPASVTPFLENGGVDEPGVVRILSWFQSQGCAGVVLAGTNGEGPSLSAVEKRDLVRTAVPLYQDLKIILGVATPGIEEAVWSCETARKAGAAAALVMPPAYFREVSLDQIAAWFELLCRRTSLPIIAYNFPQRTGFSFTFEFVERIFKIESVIGLKDSSGLPDNVERFEPFAVQKLLFTGDETLLMPGLARGWSGSISGAANSMATWLVQVVKEYASNPQSAQAKAALIAEVLGEIHHRRQPAVNKALVQKMGIIDRASVRLPLTPASPSEVDDLWEKVSKLLPPEFQGR